MFQQNNQALGNGKPFKVTQTQRQLSGLQVKSQELENNRISLFRYFRQNNHCVIFQTLSSYKIEVSTKDSCSKA